MTDSSETEKRPFPEKGCLMGLDYGTKRLGIAVSNREQTIASPLTTYTRGGEQQDARRLKSLADEYQVVGLVVGLPVHMSGDEGGKAREARVFGEWAAQITGRPVRYWDERNTSLIAESYLLQAELTSKKRKARLDKLAAQVMLQSFLESPDREQRPGPI